jgi:2,3,4,5-tetrahydropyridine-2-carboxylate N-succinyltransferase
MSEIEKFQQTIADLESGKVRVAEKVDGQWQVNSWVKEVIL